MSTVEAPDRTPATSAGGRALTGTWPLVRFYLRRDRITLPAWLLILTALVFYYAAALSEMYGDAVESFGPFMTGPVGALLAGPGYGREAVTIEIAFVGIYGLYHLLAAALMNILLISRHTRVEEQTGRAELIRANVVGRFAPLSAALIVALGANIALSLLIGAAMSANFGNPDAWLFGASVGAVGLVFAGITAVTTQISEYSRAGSGMAGALLGAAYVIRAVGDMLAGDGHGTVLSWLSPVAWSQQTRAYVDGRWWPLLLSVGLAAVAAGVGYALLARRDFGAGLVAARPGRPEAAAWLRSPLALALRTHRAALLWWSVAFAASGLLFGGITQPVVDALTGTGGAVIDLIGGDPTSMADGFLSVMGLMMALLAGVFGILGAQAVRAEETRGRAEPVLATAVSRVAWFGSHVVVLAVGVVLLLLVAGLTLGVSAALSTGDSDYVRSLLGAHLVWIPAVLLVLGVATLLYGLLPRAVGAAWVVLGYGLFMGFFGAMLVDVLPSWLFDISPFEHIPRLPLEPMRWSPLVMLTVVAVGLMLAGLAAFNRRDLDRR